MASGLPSENPSGLQSSPRAKFTWLPSRLFHRLSQTVRQAATILKRSDVGALLMTSLIRGIGRSRGGMSHSLHIHCLPGSFTAGYHQVIQHTLGKSGGLFTASTSTTTAVPGQVVQLGQPTTVLLIDTILLLGHHQVRLVRRAAGQQDQE